MAIVSMKALLETGVHFGHRTRRWNPKMKRYIFTERSRVHIIDLQQTITALTLTSNLVRDVVAGGGMIMFVGTKRQARDTIEQEAVRCEMPYVNRRWLGGTLTNWRTIRQRIDYLFELEARRDRGDFERLTKKEALGFARQIEKLNNRLGGIREMRGVPDLLFVVDVRREATAVAEANRLGIPIVAIVDTNCDPDPIDYVVPANDDAIRAIKLITLIMSDAVLEGVAQRKAQEPEAIGIEEILTEDEKYLSAATIARLRELTFEEEAKVEEPATVEVEPVAGAAETSPEAAEGTDEPPGGGAEVAAEPLAEAGVVGEPEGGVEVAAEPLTEAVIAGEPEGEPAVSGEPLEEPDAQTEPKSEAGVAEDKESWGD